jgi:hypothetical protein
VLDPISNSEVLFHGGDKASRKKKDEEYIDLRWSNEEIEKMEERNEKGNSRKGRFDPGVLMLTLGQDEEDYKKVFEKQIAGDKRFPPSLRNVTEAVP